MFDDLRAKATLGALIIAVSLLCLPIAVHLEGYKGGGSTLVGMFVVAPAYLGSIPGVAYLTAFMLVFKVDVEGGDEAMAAFALKHVPFWIGVFVVLWWPTLGKKLGLTAVSAADAGATAYGSIVGRKDQPSKEEVERAELAAELEKERSELERLQKQIKDLEAERGKK